MSELTAPLPAGALQAMARYAAERYPVRRFLPLALFLASVSTLAGAPPGGPAALAKNVAGGAVLALVLVFGLRLWDDLADVAHDRRAHPSRVLSRVRRLAPFVTLAATALVVALAALAAAGGTGRALGVFGLCSALAAWYRWRPARPAPGTVASLLHAHTVLVKYPAVVLVLAPGPLARPLRAAAVALVVFSCLGLYEIAHDARVRGARGARVAIIAHAVVIGAGALAAGVRLLTPLSGGPP